MLMWVEEETLSLALKTGGQMTRKGKEEGLYKPNPEPAAQTGSDFEGVRSWGTAEP